MNGFYLIWPFNFYLSNRFGYNTTLYLILSQGGKKVHKIRVASLCNFFYKNLSLINNEFDHQLSQRQRSFPDPERLFHDRDTTCSTKRSWSGYDQPKEVMIWITTPEKRKGGSMRQREKKRLKFKRKLGESESVTEGKKWRFIIKKSEKVRTSE